MRRILVLSFALLVIPATSARADLIDLKNGMIYDTLQDLTWLQDLGARGPTIFEDAVTWVDQLEYGGFTDWRLPRMYNLELEWTSDSEVNRVMTQLGGYWLSPPDVPHFDYQPPPNVGPFINGTGVYWLQRPDGPPRGYYAWLVFREVDWAPFHWDYDEPGPSVMAVRDGGPEGVQRVPEPSTLLMLSIGALAMMRKMIGSRLRVVRSSTVRSTLGPQTRPSVSRAR